MKLLSIILAAAVLLPVSAAHAETDGARCDRLAAHPGEPTKPAGIAGVATGEIDVTAAIEACAAALRSAPETMRYQYQLGRAYFDQKDFTTAFRLFKAASVAGFPMATSSLGYLYDQGLGTERNPALAIATYRQAADAGIGQAAANLAISYRDGVGVTADPKASLAFFRRAAELGHDASIVDIGYAYDSGLGVAIDYAEAKRWYELGVEKGQPLAMNNLGNLYEAGTGVAQDRKLALSWYQKAMAEGLPYAMMNVAHFTDQGWEKAADAEEAATLVMQAFADSNAEDDGFNRDFLIETEWTPAFWRALQTRLASAGHFHGEATGTLDQATRSSIDALIDRE